MMSISPEENHDITLIRHMWFFFSGTFVPIRDKGEQFDVNAPPKFNAQIRIQHMHSSPRLPVMPSTCWTGTQETEVEKRRGVI